jgi:(2R)-sulfolactate sulfo-lyase subunit beta
MDDLVRRCNARMIAAEALGHREFVMTKLYPSASEERLNPRG